MTELTKNFKIGKNVNSATRSRILKLVKSHWDSFCSRGARRPILGYEFTINTGNHTPLCCKKPTYGPHKAPIIMDNIHTLLSNNWIEECHGPWGSMVVLAAKPHQEHITNIKDFIWRMCVSYRKLNSVTEPFEYPIPRCDDAVNAIGIQDGRQMFFISLDAKQGYHQVVVATVDRPKLAFFAPDGKKYTFKVMPFGPTNAPAFYTCMMNDFQQDWNLLFFTRLRTMPTISNTPVTVSSDNIISIANKRIELGSKVIIDDILLYSTNLDILLLYFDCICTTFSKYRCSFQLKKCEFLKDRVEYVGHDLTSDGNCPAQSKFNLIHNWPLPTSGQSLHSLIGLLNFYHKYIPFMEIKLKPLRALERKFRRKSIPLIAWTTQLTTLFTEMKQAITSSPVLARFDMSKPIFLKTDWSASAMAYILMQPDDSNESILALKKLNTSGECDFDLSLEGPRFRPIAFGSRSCTDTEKHFHSFVGEVATGRWAIAQNKRYLWGSHFYWLCDCSAVKEVLDYTGTIHMVSRWAQELLGYSFSVVHRSAKMMGDVDALTRRFGNHLASHFFISTILRGQDRLDRPRAYLHTTFSKQPTRIKSKSNAASESNLPIFTSVQQHNLYSSLITPIHTLNISAPTNPSPLLTITSSPLSLTTPTITPPPATQVPTLALAAPPSDTPTALYNITNALSINILCVDDLLHTTFYQCHHQPPLPFSWHVFHIFSIPPYFPSPADMPQPPPSVIPLNQLHLSPLFHHHQFHFLDFTYHPRSQHDIYTWLNLACHCIAMITPKQRYIISCTLWVTTSYLPLQMMQAAMNAISHCLPTKWRYIIHHCHTPPPLIAERYSIILTYNDPSTDHLLQPFLPTNPTPPFSTSCISDCLLPNTPSNFDIHFDTDIIQTSLPSSILHQSSNHSPTLPRQLCTVHHNQSNQAIIVYDPLYPAAEPFITHPTPYSFAVPHVHPPPSAPTATYFPASSPAMRYAASTGTPSHQSSHNCTNLQSLRFTTHFTTAAHLLFVTFGLHQLPLVPF